MKAKLVPDCGLINYYAMAKYPFKPFSSRLDLGMNELGVETHFSFQTLLLDQIILSLESD